MNNEGILLINKSKGKTSFSIVSQLRKITKIRKIGHCGTLDPFATGVMVMLLGKNYTKKSDQFILHDKEYEATVTLGKVTATYDSESEINDFSNKIPTIDELKETLTFFQGYIYQTPPMYSAKKINGQKLYNLARKGITIEREKIKVHVETTLISYNYPQVILHIVCTKGTYVRSIAHDLGIKLATGAYLSALTRTRSGPFYLKDCVDQDQFFQKNFDPLFFIKKLCP